MELKWTGKALSDLGQALVRPFFLGTGGMLVGFDEGAVNEGFLEIGILGKCGKDRMPDPFLRPYEPTC